MTLPLQQAQRKEKKLADSKAAVILGVSRWHLCRIVRGHLQSPALLQRYNSLQSGEGGAAVALAALQTHAVKSTRRPKQILP